MVSRVIVPVVELSPRLLGRLLPPKFIRSPERVLDPVRLLILGLAACEDIADNIQLAGLHVVVAAGPDDGLALVELAPLLQQRQSSSKACMLAVSMSKVATAST